MPDNDSDHRGTVYEDEEQGERLLHDRSGWQSRAAKEAVRSRDHQVQTATFECGRAAEGPVTFDSCWGCCTAANRQRSARRRLMHRSK